MENQHTLSETAALAARFIHYTGKNIFLTGKAGTGKTTFLKYIMAHTCKKALITAPTGIAAINAGGVTLHSLFQLPFGGFVPFNQSNALPPQLRLNDPLSLVRGLFLSDKKRELLRELQLLVIDEVSMLRADLLDAIDTVLRYVRKQSKPFGGVQVLFIGDLQQLPPVIKDEEWKILKDYYNSAFFFDARVLKQEAPVYIELDKIFRQNDPEFIHLLNQLRHNQVGETEIALLNRHYKPGFRPAPTDNYITLTTHNYKADSINKAMLQQLPGKAFVYEANIEGEFNDFAYPVEKSMVLKEGAQVMFIKNDPSGARRYFNGRLARISRLKEQSVEVQFEDQPEPFVVEKAVWENNKYELDEVTNEIEEQIAGTFRQYPLRLAWAITVHKSQGLTFDKAIVDTSGAFAPGQVYVALSRLRSLSGLILSSPVNYNSLKQDEHVDEFSKTQLQQENPETIIRTESFHFLKTSLCESFNFNKVEFAFNQHADSYDKDEKRSAKQKHRAWALALTKKVAAFKDPADKFAGWIQRKLDARESNYMHTISKRIQDACNYFSPLLDSCCKDILNKLIEIKPEKKIKAYAEELLALELLLHEQHKQLYRAFYLCGSFAGNTLPDKEQNGLEKLDKERRLRIQELKDSGGLGKEAKPVLKKEAMVKQDGAEEKIPSSEESVRLIRQGKTAEEVAQLRGLSISTVEGHIAKYIALRKLEAHYFISSEKVKKISEASKQLNTLNLTPIKELLGEAFSYRDVRYGIAACLAAQEEK